MRALLLLTLIVPLVMVLVGALLKRNPAAYPTSGHGSSGYNTPRSRRSQASWDYAQIIAPDIFLRWGKTAFAVSAVSIAAGLVIAWWYVPLAVGYLVGFGFLAAAFVETERALKERFGR